MDTLAHGLWGGAAFGQKTKEFKWAFLLGMGPDLFSFGPYFLTRWGDIGERLAGRQSGPPDPSTIPAYVYHAYNVTHSLVIWAAVVAVLWGVSAYRRSLAPSPIRSLWPLGAWALHILCDIPTHSTRFFPTPYLWPFPTPFVNGDPWANKSFMLLNYGAIALTYMVLIYRKRR